MSLADLNTTALPPPSLLPCLPPPPSPVTKEAALPLNKPCSSKETISLLTELFSIWGTCRPNYPPEFGRYSSVDIRNSFLEKWKGKGQGERGRGARQIIQVWYLEVRLPLQHWFPGSPSLIKMIFREEILFVQLMNLDYSLRANGNASTPISIC